MPERTEYIFKDLLFFCYFSWRDGLIQEEKLEPLRNMTDDPRIRLLNRLYARKRKELKEREKLKVIRFSSLLCRLYHWNIDDCVWKIGT